MPLLPGDPAPSFHARSNANPRYAFDTAAGRHLVLCLFADGQEAVTAHTLARLAASRQFDDHRASLFLVSRSAGDEGEGRLPVRLPGVRAFFDHDHAIARLYQVPVDAPGPVSIIISPRLQILATLDWRGAAEHAEAVLTFLADQPHPAQMPPLAAHAPVMMIPDVLERDLCRTLIEGYLRHGGQPSGFMRDVNGKTTLIRDRTHKVRRDWDMEEGDPLRARLQALFIRRVVPQLHKAYQFQVTRMERYLVACYDAEEGGHFRPHRDNTTLGTAHRRFAVTVNLNAEEYDGGGLRFPEFGQTIYKAPTGGAVVFSCSLLHEATPVTRGRRFAFLPFLYDEAARKVREANFQHLAAREDPGERAEAAAGEDDAGHGLVESAAAAPRAGP